MRVHKLAWLGVRTHASDEMKAFLRDVLGVPIAFEKEGFVLAQLSDGAKVEIFDKKSPFNAHFDTAPVAGFLVDNIESAARELEEAGIELVGSVESEGTSSWIHFRAPDGNLYELTQDSSVQR